MNPEDADHRIAAKRGGQGSTPHSEGPGDTPGERSGGSLGGLWPGQRGPIGLNVIAVRPTAGSRPRVVRGQHLTESVASTSAGTTNMELSTDGLSVRLTPCLKTERFARNL